MKANHSPAPWTLERAGTGELLIATAESPDPVTRARHTFIAQLSEFSKANPMWEWPTADEQHANGKLMVAAPELLAACRALLAGAEWTLMAMPDIPNPSEFRSAMEDARAAIAKATA